jgi:hypothetical protein
MSKTKTVKVTAKASVYDTAQAVARLSSLIPSRSVGKLTARQKDLISYDKIINTNKASFSPGSSMTRGDLVTMFSIPNVDPNPNAVGTFKVLQKHGLKLVDTLRKINDVLNHSGLHAKSRDYGSHFIVCKKELTKKTLVLHSARVERLEARQSILEANVHNRVKVKKNFGKILRVIRGNGAIVNVLPVRAKPVTLASTSNTFNRVKHI